VEGPVLAVEAGNCSLARASFPHAIDIPRRKNSKWLELLSAMSLCRLQKEQARSMKLARCLPTSYAVKLRDSTLRT
jgi:hypothetical protein